MMSGAFGLHQILTLDEGSHHDQHRRAFSATGEASIFFLETRDFLKMFKANISTLAKF
jgi:hypothetical protein